MPPVKKVVPATEITIDVSQPVGNVGGARQMGNVMVCDFSIAKDDKTDTPGELVWKPFMDLNIEAAVVARDDDTVLMFIRRRVMPNV